MKFNTAAATLAVALLATTSTAAAQLVSSSNVFYYDYNDNGSVSYPAGGEPTPTFTDGAGTMTLTMDAHYTLDIPANNNAVVGAAIVLDPISPLPIEITPSLLANFKLVNSGGPADTDDVTATASWLFTIIETGSFAGDTDNDGYVPFGDLVGFGATIDQESGFTSQSGNGFRVIDDELNGDAYVLAPGVSYTLIAALGFSGSTVDGTSDDPTSVVTVEAGGVSGFSGLTLDLNARFVPEPASLGLLGLPALALIRRRR